MHFPPNSGDSFPVPHLHCNSRHRRELRAIIGNNLPPNVVYFDVGRVIISNIVNRVGSIRIH